MEFFDIFLKKQKKTEKNGVIIGTISQARRKS